MWIKKREVEHKGKNCKKNLQKPMANGGPAEVGQPSSGGHPAGWVDEMQLT